MAGFLSKEEIEKLLIENDCKKTDSKYISIEPDTVLYETIQALEKKYGKTKITFAWPKSIDKSYDGHFSKHKNTIQINLKNIIETARNNSKGEQNTI